MQKEACRIVSTWLKNSTDGVNAQIRKLQAAGMFDSDTPPEAVRFIGDMFSNEEVARWEEPPMMPAIYVAPDGPAVTAGRQQPNIRRTEDLLVAIRVILGEEKSFKSITDTQNLLLAVVESISALLLDKNKSSRLRGPVYLEAGEITYGSWSEAIGGARATGAVVVRWNARLQAS